MIVAVIVVRMVQLSIDQIIHMVPMGHLQVSALRAMLVLFTCDGPAAVRVGAAHLNNVLIDMPVVQVMQMAVVEIIYMPLVDHRGVAAVGAVLVRVILMNVALFHHGYAPFIVGLEAPSKAGHAIPQTFHHCIPASGIER
jgi:hypothetical protein